MPEELVNQDRGNELEDWSVDPRTEEKHGDLPEIPSSESREGISRPNWHGDLPYWQTLGLIKRPCFKSGGGSACL